MLYLRRAHSAYSYFLQPQLISIASFVKTMESRGHIYTQLGRDPDLQACKGMNDDMSVMQVLSVHLNRIRVLHSLRDMIRDCCLVGFIGEINSGKTTMTRLLQGLEPEEEGQAAENATRCIAGDRLKLRTAAGLEATPQSPIIIDTPGMFDPDRKLNDAARYHGGFLLHPTYLYPSCRCGTGNNPHQDQDVIVLSIGLLATVFWVH